MDDVTEAILAANDRFYRALSLADFSAMQRVWLATEEAVCVHPGWPPLHGWPAIRESWRRIFQNQGPLHIRVSEAEVRLYGHTAEVNCVENIDTAQIEGAGLTRTRAANIFRLTAERGEWKMLEHHAVPMPPGGQPQAPGRFSIN